ncbi:MAG: hypothetical protein K2Q22_07915, partial [Cytophagales bacterium]|nr:hypothetical protein [Cytophagales bacterium]
LNEFFVGYFNNYSSTASVGGEIFLSRYNGTSAAPTAVKLGDELGAINFGGYDGSGPVVGAWISTKAASKYDNFARGTDMEFYTVPTTSTLAYKALTITNYQTLRLPSLTQPSSPVTGDVYADGTSIYYYDNTNNWQNLVTGGPATWNLSGGNLYANYGTSISGIATVGGFNIQNIKGIASGLSLGIDPSTGEVGTISGGLFTPQTITLSGLNTLTLSGGGSVNLPTTSLVGSGIISSTNNGLTTYTIPSGFSPWTTTAGNNFISSLYNTSISGISTVGGLNIKSITSVNGAYLGINSNGQVGTIAGSIFTPQTITLAGFNTLTLSGGGSVNLPTTSLVGSGIVSSTNNGLTTYTIPSSFSPWTTTAGNNFISALYSTSISGISTVGGLNIRSLSSVTGALMSINSNGVVGTIAGVMSQWASSTSTTPGIYYSGGNVGIGTTAPNKFAALDISSNTAGVLFPRMTSAQRTTLGLNFGPSDDGMLVNDTDTKNFINYYYTNSTSFGWNGGGGGNNNSSSSGNVAWNYNATATGLGQTVSLNNAYAGVYINSTVSGIPAMLTVNGGQLNNGT